MGLLKAQIAALLRNDLTIDFGYQNFPGGLILQWRVLYFIAGGYYHTEVVSQNLPKAFPNAVIGFWGSTDVYNSNKVPSISFPTYSLSTFSLRNINK